MSTPLAEVLNPTGAPPAPPQEAPEAPEPEQAEATPEETSQEADTPPEKPEEPQESSPDSDSKNVPLSALHGERDRRKEAEQRAKELEQRLTALEKAEKGEQKRPSVFEDEDAAFQTSEQRVNEAVSQQLLAAGESMAVQEYGEDIARAAEEWALEAVKTSPSLEAQLQSTPLMFLHKKAIELYQQEQKRMELADPDAYREKLEAEVREKVRKEMEAEQKAKADKRKSIPKSLVGDESKGSLTGSDWSGPTPLSAVLKK